MFIELSYTNADAQNMSKKGNPIPLYALAQQGTNFVQGNFVQVTAKPQRFYSGIIISRIQPNVFGLIVPVTNLNALGLTLATGAKMINITNEFPIEMDMVSHNGMVLVEYGQHLADLYFLQGAE